MSLTPALLAELRGALLVSVPILVLFGTCEWLYHRRGVAAEVTRKTSHVGAGLTVFSMPWLVTSHWTVLLLSIGFVIILGGSKLVGLLPSVHAVDRRTSGAQYYPLAVYMIFVLADGSALLFQVPILVMALSDTGAAVVGRRYGIVRYRVVDDYRSLGGSTTFFGLTFAVVLVALGVAGYGDLPAVLIVTLLVATIATAVEGISTRGADNLLVPYATFLVLRSTMDASREVLGDWVLGTALCFGVLLAAHRAMRLNATSFMAAFLAGVLAWGLGGPLWLACLAVPLVCVAVARRAGDAEEFDLPPMVSAFAVSVGLILLHGHLHDAAIFVAFLGSTAAITSISLTHTARRRGVGPAGQALAALLGAAVATVPTLLLFSPAGPVALAVAAGGALVGPPLARGLERAALSPAAVRLGAVVGGTSTSALWLALSPAVA